MLESISSGGENFEAELLSIFRGKDGGEYRKALENAVEILQATLKDIPSQAE